MRRHLFYVAPNVVLVAMAEAFYRPQVQGVGDVWTLDQATGEWRR